MTISGADTKWTNATTVNFGPGITASITAATPASLSVNLKIDGTAPAGPRDVTVGNGTLKGAFQVEPPIKLVEVKGTLAQGSIFIARVEQKDMSTPFDTTSADHIKLTSAPGLTATVQSVQPYAIDFNMQVDVGVAPGSFDLRVDSGSADAVVSSQAAKAITIAARSPSPLVAGKQSPGSVAAPYESYLYSFVPGAHKLVRVNTSAMNSAAHPQYALLPESGKFADLVSLGATGQVITEKAAEPIYIIYWDSSGTTGYPFDIDISSADSNDLEPNNECAMAQTLDSSLFSLKNLLLRSATDEDWFAVPVAAADVGKSLEVTTSPGDARTDTRIEVYSGDCASLLPIGASADDDYHDLVRVGPLYTAGTYYVRITGSKARPYEGAGYNVDFSLGQLPSETEPNDTCQQADPGGDIGYKLGPLTLPSLTDVDWFVFQASATDVGKMVHAITAPGDFDTDTGLEVFDGTCAALNSLGGPSDDAGYQEDWTSTPITQAGNIYVKVSYSTFGYAGSNYDLYVMYAP